MDALMYGIGREIAEPFDAVLPRVTDALKAEGFGIITQIDVKKTMKEKIGADIRPHTILGACNPKLAHAALEVEPDLGVLLPCNVDVYEVDGGTRVVGLNAGAIMGIVGNERLLPIADEIQTRLGRAIDSL